MPKSGDKRQVYISVWHRLIAIAAPLVMLGLISLPSISHSKHSETGKHPFVISGVVLSRGNTELLNSFVSMLEQRTGYPLYVEYVDSYADLSKTLRQHPDAIGWTCGAPFIEDHQSDQQQLVAVPLLNGKPTYHSVIITRAGNKSEQHLQDFKGKVLAYSDPRSNSGFLAPTYALMKEGIDIHQHFRVLMHARNHEGSISAVLSGIADVAAIDEYIMDEYFKTHPDARKALREVERYGPFPFTPIVAGNGVTDDILSKFQQTLTELPMDTEGKQMMNKFSLDGFVTKPPSFYDSIAHMLRTVENNQ
jgi:phosphonate transport system substrate-binding protein